MLSIKTDLPQLAFVGVGYRLADGKAMTNQFPSQEEDVKACIEYVMNNRAEYGISDKFAIIGGSAGAHLAMLYAYKYGPGSYQPAGVISWVGPANLSNIHEQLMMTNDPSKNVYDGWFVDAVGGTSKEKPELCFTSSPINYITSTSSPTLMLYGEDDTIVPRQQADELDAKLTSIGVKHTYKLYPGQGHGLTDVFPEVIKETVEFLKVYLK
jgi:acetyl esterase/lipase